MTAFEYIKEFRDCGYLPMSTERPCTVPSNSEIKRWFKRGSILINGEKAKMDDERKFPVKGLVFHPKGKRKCTMI